MCKRNDRVALAAVSLTVAWALELAEFLDVR
jgi:hypothetical protein